MAKRRAFIRKTGARYALIDAKFPRRGVMAKVDTLSAIEAAAKALEAKGWKVERGK